MDKNNRNAAIAALVILAVFGLGAYFLPALMISIGNVSTFAAAIFGILFVAAFFMVFWLRGRSRR